MYVSFLATDQDLVLYISNETKERPTRPSPHLLSWIRLESILRLRPGERIRTVVEKWLEDVSARDCQIPFFAKDAVAVSVLTMCTNMLRGITKDEKLLAE